MTASRLARLAPARWLRSPRPTARLRLTLLYGALFMVSGALLIAVSYVFASHAISITVPGSKPAPPSAAATNPAGVLGAVSPRNQTVHLTPAQTASVHAQASARHARAVHGLLIGSGLALAGMTVLSLALGWLLAGRVLRPVRGINAAARRIGASSLHERLATGGPDDEFRELAVTLNDLFERLQASFDSQRRFVANASHELRTPLTLDRALLERALRKPDPTGDFWRETCERLLASSQQQDRLIAALLTLARSERALDCHERCELGAIVDDVLLGRGIAAERTGLDIQTHLEPALIEGDPSLIERLIRNLLDNAIHYNVDRGRVEVATEARDRRAVLTITNTGPVVAARDVERLRQPFQRAGGDRISNGDGVGLGLSIVQAIATAHHATLTLTPRPAGGLQIEVSFPSRAGPPRRSPREPMAAAVHEPVADGPHRKIAS
jgi:signal transduction histidine kinase